MDCSPSVVVDVGLNDLENLFRKMVGKEQSQNKLDEFRYYSDENGSHETTDDSYQTSIVDGIKKWLDDEIKQGKGVFSLAGHWNSPLMWSHYADEHRGICIEYDKSVCDAPKEVDYQGARGIPVSEILSWVCEKSITAKEKIERKYFYTKAGQWEYENEWRCLAGSQGRLSAPFDIVGIYFGMRCEQSVVSSVVNLMRQSVLEINFYGVSPATGYFELIRSQLTDEELNHRYRPMRSPNMIFGRQT